MEGWIKRPNIANINKSSAARSEVPLSRRAMAATAKTEQDDFFDEFEDAFEDEDTLRENVAEDLKMQNSEAYFNQQMEEFRQKSAELQRLIDAQQQNQMNAAQTPNNQYVQAHGYNQQAGYVQPTYGQNAYNQNNYVQNGYNQNPYANQPYNQNPYPVQQPQMEQFPRYPYPAPQMQPGMGQMPQAGFDGVAKTPATPEPILQTMDLSGIVGELEQVLNAGVSDIKSSMSSYQETDMSGLQSDFEVMRDNMTDLQAGFNEVKSDVSSLRVDMNDLSQSVTSATADLSNIQDELTRRLDEATRKVAEETRQTLAEAQNSIEEATRTIEQNTQSFDGLKEQIEAMTGHGEKIDQLSGTVDGGFKNLKEEIHKENVKEYRNIRKSFDEQNENSDKNTGIIAGKIEDLLANRLQETELKLKEQSKRQVLLLVFAIVDFLGVVGILLLQSGIIK